MEKEKQEILNKIISKDSSVFFEESNNREKINKQNAGLCRFKDCKNDIYVESKIYCLDHLYEKRMSRY